MITLSLERNLYFLSKLALKGEKEKLGVEGRLKNMLDLQKEQDLKSSSDD